MDKKMMVRRRLVLLFALLCLVSLASAIPQTFSIHGDVALPQVVGSWLLVVGWGVKPLASRFGNVEVGL